MSNILSGQREFSFRRVSGCRILFMKLNDKPMLAFREHDINKWVERMAVRERLKLLIQLVREIYIFKKTSTGKVREFQKPLAEATVC